MRMDRRAGLLSSAEEEIVYTTTITSSQTWVVPYTGTYLLNLYGGGGGGGGGAGKGNFLTAYGTGGGGGGSSRDYHYAYLIKDQSYYITIGSGGLAGTAGAKDANGGSGGNGGVTSFGALLLTPGGIGGGGGIKRDGGNGASGVGAGFLGKSGEGGNEAAGGTGAINTIGYGCGGNGGNGSESNNSAGEPGTAGAPGAAVITYVSKKETSCFTAQLVEDDYYGDGTYVVNVGFEPDFLAIRALSPPTMKSGTNPYEFDQCRNILYIKSLGLIEQRYQDEGDLAVKSSVSNINISGAIITLNVGTSGSPNFYGTYIIKAVKFTGASSVVYNNIAKTNTSGSGTVLDTRSLSYAKKPSCIGLFTTGYSSNYRGISIFAGMFDLKANIFYGAYSLADDNINSDYSFQYFGVFENATSPLLLGMRNGDPLYLTYSDTAFSTYYWTKNNNTEPNLNCILYTS